MKDLFFKPIKIVEKDQNILFWGCTHFGHAPSWDIPLWKRRGFNSVEEHDETLIKNWNSHANENTIGFLLGDNIFGHKADERLDVILKRLIFKHLYAMPGNHFSGWKQHFENLAFCENKKCIDTGTCYKYVYFVPNYLEAFINGQAVVMSHYPILSFNGQGNGAWHLFSHVHGSLENSEIGKLYLQNMRVLETSVEKNPFPLRFTDVRQKLQNKEIKTADHHGPHTQNPF